MKVSFDLDETLFVDPQKIQVEKELRWPYNIIYKEKLRKNTLSLFNKLLSENIDLYIYTTSFRSISYIKAYFKRYGFNFNKNNIINGDIYKLKIQKNKNIILPSKMPSYFDIAIHVDDDISVKQNGDINGWKTILIKEEDTSWDIKILEQILKYRNTQVDSHAKCNS